MAPGVLAASSDLGVRIFGTGIYGLVLGGIFAVSALGLVLVYRVTGVLNFAQGAMGMYSTFVAWWIVFTFHPLAANENAAFTNPPSIAIAVLGALLFSLLLGLILQWGVFWWLQGRPALVKAVVTVGILLSLQSLAAMQFGSTQYHEALKFFDPSRCPAANSGCFSWQFRPLAIGWDQMLVIAAAIVLTVVLVLFLRYSRIGIAMRAVSEDPVAASLYGVPVGLVGSASWMLGSVIAAVAGILLVSEGVTFDTITLTLIVVDALAAAMIGGLVSLPLTVAGGFILGMLEAGSRLYAPDTIGLPRFVAIVVILVALLARSQRSLLRAKS
jgi:branched-subunit amino acid ABC-type transport system permease component